MTPKRHFKISIEIESIIRVPQQNKLQDFLCTATAFIRQINRSHYLEFSNFRSFFTAEGKSQELKNCAFLSITTINTQCGCLVYKRQCQYFTFNNNAFNIAMFLLISACCVEYQCVHYRQAAFIIVKQRSLSSCSVHYRHAAFTIVIQRSLSLCSVHYRHAAFTIVMQRLLSSCSVHYRHAAFAIITPR